MVAFLRFSCRSEASYWYRHLFLWVKAERRRWLSPAIMVSNDVFTPAKQSVGKKRWSSLSRTAPSRCLRWSTRTLPCGPGESSRDTEKAKTYLPGRPQTSRAALRVGAAGMATGADTGERKRAGRREVDVVAWWTTPATQDHACVLGRADLPVQIGSNIATAQRPPRPLPRPSDAVTVGIGPLDLAQIYP